jgi:hypothetical protein
VIAHDADARTGPAVAAPRGLARAVENRGDGLVRKLTGERGDELDHIGIGSPAMLARAVLTHPQGRVVTAHPSDHQVERVVLDPHHDLFDQRADDPLAGRRRRTRTMPGALDVGAEREQAFAFGLGERRRRARRQRIPLIFERMHGEQARVPALLQLGGDEAVVGVDCIVLPPRPDRLVARACSIASSTWRRCSAFSARRASMAPIAASMPSG